MTSAGLLAGVRAPLGGGTAAEDLSQDEVFDVLSSARRRFALSYLWRVGGSSELSTLADETAAWENGTPVSELTSQQRKRLYVSLYQTHVPKMADLGIVDYDADTGAVRISDGAAEVARYLPQSEPAAGWEWYYLLLAGLSAAFFLGVTYDVPVLGGVPEVAAAVVVVLAFVALAALHRVYAERTRLRVLGTLVEHPPPEAGEANG